ncbi:putative nuclease HARBI1 [Myzus persicae]|uniref:putative nuclease HARBI1 n=1 Tax=Myzus persicae TaxID=13164 RepID=UPI000B939EE7|nr:putative nuclease HARBI1 [Myzus persicae]
MNYVPTALWKLLSPIYLPTPREEDWIKISNEFNQISNFPNCTGAIDGKHIAIQCPPSCAGSEYFYYKGFHSIVLQAVVDALPKFITIDVGEYGRSSDSGIFKESNFGKMLLHNELNLPPSRKMHDDINEEYPFVFVGDEVYPSLPCLMRPFLRINLTNETRIFNYRQSDKTNSRMRNRNYG